MANLYTFSMGVKTDIADLFERYQDHGDLAARDELVTHYLEVADYVAKMTFKGLSNVEFDDIQAFAYLGLLDAIDKFDVSRDVKFETYAVTRIRGAIIDNIRSLDWVPRSVRSKVRRVDKASTRVAQRIGHDPTDEQVAQELHEMDTKDVSHARYEASVGYITSYDQPVSDDEGATATLGDLLEGGHEPDDFVERWRIRDAMAKAVQNLDERGRMMVALYYLEDVRLADIGAVQGVTESRICQIHTKVLQELARAVGIEVA